MLTKKKTAFVRKYLVDLNATQAATRAGYSKKTAKSQGQRLLTDVDVKRAIQEAMNKRAEKTKLTADKVLKGIQDVLNMAIAEGDKPNALRALELQGKHLKLFTDKVETSGQVALNLNLGFNKKQ